MQEDNKPENLDGTPEKNVNPAKRTRIKKEEKGNLTRGYEGGEKPFKRTKKTLEDGKTYVGGRLWDEGRKPVRKELASRGERKTISIDSRPLEDNGKPVKRISRASKDERKVFTKSSRISEDERKPFKKAEKNFSHEDKGRKLERKSLKRVGKSRVTEDEKPKKRPIYGYGDKKVTKAPANTGRAQNSRKSSRTSDWPQRNSDWTAKDTERSEKAAKWSTKPPKSSGRPAKRTGKPATGATGHKPPKPKDNSQWWPSSKGRRRNN